MSDIFVDNIKHQSSQGSGTITIGASGEKVDLGATAGGTLTNRPAFSANAITGTFTGSVNTFWKATFNNELYDTNSAYDASNSRFTVFSLTFSEVS